MQIKLNLLIITKISVVKFSSYLELGLNKRKGEEKIRPEKVAFNLILNIKATFSGRN